MKKLLLLVAGSLFVGTIAAQSIPNGGFENWTTTTWNDPKYFMTSNDQLFSNGIDTANLTETTGYLGVNYGVQLKTINTSQGIQAGYMLDGTGNNGISGGIAYNQKPTGVRFYYKWDPATSDTAGVIVGFTLLGQQTLYFDTILNAAANYTLFQKTFNPPLPLTPDTVVFAAISSIAAINNGGGHVGSILTIDSITFTGVSSQPANMNGDFQTWNNDTILTPSWGWYTNYPNVTRTTDADSGMYALELETLTGGHNSGTQAGQASTGYYPNCNNNNCQEKGGVGYTPTASKKDTLQFSYKYAPITGDTASISLQFKNDSLLYFANIYLHSSTNGVYRDTSLAIDLGSTNPQPDSVIVTILSSWHGYVGNGVPSQYAGSILKIDNMTFSSQKALLGIKPISAMEGIKVYPNPTNSQINIDLTNLSGSLEKIALYDMSGRLLSTQNYSGGLRSTMKTIDMSGFSSGIYLIEATTTNGNFYQKVCKQ